MRAECGITLTFSSPYHHQANSIAEKSVGTCKSLWKKAIESKQCPDTAFGMYRITPLDDQLPSPYKLLYGRKPRSLLSNSKSALQSKHPYNDEHQEAKLRKQTRQADYYNRSGRASRDKRVLDTSEPNSGSLCILFVCYLVLIFFYLFISYLIRTLFKLAMLNQTSCINK